MPAANSEPRKPGRPCQEIKADTFLQVRLTASQKGMLKQKADSKGLSMSAYVVRLIKRAR